MHISIILVIELVAFQLRLEEDSNFSNNYTPIACQIQRQVQMTHILLLLSSTGVISCWVCIIM